jgi:hypothetical protein
MSEQASAATAPAPEATTATPTGEGQPPAPADNAQADAATADTDPADETGEDASAEPRRPARGVQKRLDELTAARRAAEAREQYLLEQNAALMRMVAGGQPGAGPQAAQPAGQPGAAAPLPPDLAQYVGAPPNPDAFQAGEYDPAFIRAAALHDFRAEQARMAQAQRETAARAQMATRAQSFAEAAKAAEQRHSDFREAVSSLGHALPNPVAEAVADAGVDVAYAIAKSSELTAALKAARTPLAVGEVIGEAKARLRAASVASPPPPKPTAAAPPPAPLRGGSGGGPALLDPSRMSASEYYAARMRGDLP